MVGPLTMKLGTLIHHDKSSSKHKLQGYKQQNSLRQQRLLNGVSAYNLLMMGPLTMKLGALM